MTTMNRNIKLLVLTSGSRHVSSLIGLPLKLMCSSSGQLTSASRPLAIWLSLKSNCNTAYNTQLTIHSIRTSHSQHIKHLTVYYIHTLSRKQNTFSLSPVVKEENHRWGSILHFGHHSMAVGPWHCKTLKIYIKVVTQLCRVGTEPRPSDCKSDALLPHQ